MKVYEFTVRVVGSGDTPEEAWEDLLHDGTFRFVDGDYTNGYPQPPPSIKNGKAQITLGNGKAINLPDLWHIAMWLKHDYTKGKPLPHETAKKVADDILETWGIAHDLKKNIIEGLIKEE